MKNEKIKNSVGRPKVANSESSLLNLGLDKKIEEEFIKILKYHDLSASHITRKLIKDYVNENRHKLPKE